ncbi:hypothetical protein [Ponticaulis koreensis]|uniref:hypothetical protein n=1 Tax=Ponticaulis koreensis TaxID=1123045 RepID=UPI0003B79604|nr:hypothetical protein [Ponticaulis koreensis]
MASKKDPAESETSVDSSEKRARKSGLLRDSKKLKNQPKTSFSLQNQGISAKNNHSDRKPTVRKRRNLGETVSNDAEYVLAAAARLAGLSRGEFVRVALREHPSLRLEITEIARDRKTLGVVVPVSIYEKFRTFVEAIPVKTGCPNQTVTGTVNSLLDTVTQEHLDELSVRAFTRKGRPDPNREPTHRLNVKPTVATYDLLKAACNKRNVPNLTPQDFVIAIIQEVSKLEPQPDLALRVG